MKNLFQTILVFPVSIILFLSFMSKIGASDEVEAYVSELRHRKNIHEDNAEKDTKNLLGEQRQDVIISNPSEPFRLADFSSKILGMIWVSLPCSLEPDRIYFSYVCKRFYNIARAGNARESFRLTDLPSEILGMIWVYLPRPTKRDRAYFSNVCKRFNNIAKANKDYEEIAIASKDWKEREDAALTARVLAKLYGKRRRIDLLSGLNDEQLGGIYFGFLAPSVESGMFFRYGAGYALPYTIFPIFSIVTSRTAIHMSRSASFTLEFDKFLDLIDDRIQLIQLAHALVNHAYPMASLGLWTNIGFSLINTQTASHLLFGTLCQHIVTLLPIPSLFTSNFCKGIEVDECLVKRIVHGQHLVPASSIFTVGAYTLTALAALSKGMVIKSITDSHLEKIGADESARFWCSWGMGGLSAMLTFGFESDKLLKWGKQVISNPTSTLFASAQAAAVMSIYWGITTMDPWMAASILSLEIATETLSIQHHMKSYITPAISRFREFFNY